MLTAEGNASAQLLFAGLVLLLTMFAVLHKGRYLKLYHGLKRNLAIANQARKQTRNFENAQGKMRQSGSFDKWWKTLCSMSDNMCFKSLFLLHRVNGLYLNTCQWNTLKQDTNNSRVVELNIPLDCDDTKEFMLKACIYVDDYLELSGHQVKLLTRFIDEFPLPQSQLAVKTSDKPQMQQNSNLKNESFLNADNNDSEADPAKADFSIKTIKEHKTITNPLGTLSSSLRYIFKHHS
jgi:hypothetical protein